MSLFRKLALPFWSILIAIVLWVQVHGQGMGSLRMDVALQVRDVPTDMVIVNDLPDQVSITVSGLQAQLNSLDIKDLFVSVDASSLTLPGVIEQALDIEAIDLPVGLKVEKIQPDTVQLQVDHVIKRKLDIASIFDLPQGWKVEHVVVTPASVELLGPEVWLGTMDRVDTLSLRLDLKQGIFDIETTAAPLSGKGIHLVKPDLKVRVRGELTWTPTVEGEQSRDITDETADSYGEPKEKQVSIVPVPAAEQEQPKEVEPVIQENIPATEVQNIPPVLTKPVVSPSADIYSQPQDKVLGDL